MSILKQLLFPNDSFTCETAVSSMQNAYAKNVELFKKDLDQLTDIPLTTMKKYPDTKYSDNLETNRNHMKLPNVYNNKTALTKSNHFELKSIKRNGVSTKTRCCGICGKEFDKQYKLTRHIQIHVPTRNFKCSICDKAFRQMSTLCQHKAIHSKARPYPCQTCDKTFNRVSTLISHRKIHGEQKLHKCPHCPKAFHQKANLRNHIFTHTDERPYKCDVCGQGFNQMSNLKCHKSKIHTQAPIPSYLCVICGNDFEKRADCRKHEQNAHKEKIEKMNCPSLEASNVVINRNATDSPTPPAADLVDPINTVAMQMARENNTPPFVLLKPLVGPPVIVRVLESNGGQKLIPITWIDLCRYSQVLSLPVPDTDKSKKKYKLQTKVPIVGTLQELPASGRSQH